MSQVMKLTGVGSWTSPLLFNVRIERGEVLRVSDEVAAKIAGHSRPSMEDGVPIRYFTGLDKYNAEEHGPVKYDFTRPDFLKAASYKDAPLDPYSAQRFVTGAVARQIEEQTTEAPPSPTAPDTDEGRELAARIAAAGTETLDMNPGDALDKTAQTAEKSVDENPEGATTETETETGEGTGGGEEGEEAEKTGEAAEVREVEEAPAEAIEEPAPKVATVKTAKAKTTATTKTSEPAPKVAHRRSRVEQRGT